MKWFYVGGDSSFDTDMDDIEKMVNFHKVGQQIDIDCLYHYYVSTMLSYWVNLEEMVAFDDEDDLIDYFDELPQSGDYGISNIDNYRYSESETGAQISYYQKGQSWFKLLQQKIRPNMPEFKKLFDGHVTNIKRIYNTLSTDSSSEEKHKLIAAIMDCFKFMSVLMCGKRPTSVDKISLKYIFDPDNTLLLYPLVNKSGYHYYNSYLYAFINEINLLGFPVGPSFADGIHYCSFYFFRHDVSHTYGIHQNVDRRMCEKYYSYIMKDKKLSRNRKEYILFTLWFIIHECIRNPDIFNYDYLPMVRFAPPVFDFGVSPSNDVKEFVLNEIKRRKRMPHLIYPEVRIILDESSSNEEKDTAIALIYGTLYMEDIRKDVMSS